MEKRQFYIAAVLAALFIMACKKPPSKTKADVIEERLSLRLETWHKGVERNCLKKVMEEAEAIVDSTLLANAKSQRDTSDIPFIPGRPIKPDFVAPADTNDVKPIFQKQN